MLEFTDSLLREPLGFLVLAGAFILVALVAWYALLFLSLWLWRKMFDVPSVGYKDESKPSDWL